jgi:hypothetical protein
MIKVGGLPAFPQHCDRNMYKVAGPTHSNSVFGNSMQYSCFHLQYSYTLPHGLMFTI